MEKKKPSALLKFFAWMLAVFLFFYLLIGILSGNIGRNSYDAWKNQFANITSKDFTVLQTNSKRGVVNIGNSDNIDYGIYWIIETDKSKQEVETYYTSFVDEANTSVIGEMNYLLIDEMTDPVPLNMEDLKEYVNHFIPEQHERNVFIVAILKPGRTEFYN